MDIIPSTLSVQKLPSRFETHNNDPQNLNLTIKHHAKSNNDHAILTTYFHMESLGISADRATLPLVLKACAKLNAVERGKDIHRTARESGSIGDVRVGTALVDFYGKCGLVEDAREVFDEMRERDIVLWNAMLFGYVKCRFFEKAVSLFTRMQSQGLSPNSRTVVGLLLACKEARQLRLGQEIHGFCIRNGLLFSSPHVETALIGFYSKFDVGVSGLVFDSMSVRNIVTWNSILTGFVESGENLKACRGFLALLGDGISFDRVSLLAVVQACSELGYLDLGMQIHQLAVKSSFSNDLFVVNGLINMYSECGRLDLALKLFESVPNRDLALWNSAIDSYIKHGLYEEAVRLFASLRAERIRENGRTIAVMLPLCAHIRDGLRNGKGLHAHVIKSAMELDVYLGNVLLRMYSDLSCIDSVRRVFEEMTSVDIVSRNTLIMGLASTGLKNEAWKAFEAARSEINPNSHTIISILASCREEPCLGIGRSLHGFAVKHGFEIDPSLNTALVDMYMACGDEEMGTSLFESCPERDVISWNALIASHVRNNRAEKAQSLFRRMISEAEPDEATIVNMLSSCTQIASLSEGQSLHAYITKRKPLFDDDLSLSNALVSMYARCGSMGKAERVFELSPRRNAITWNALITGYASHGVAEEAVLTLSRMLEDNLIPNTTTFAAILSACRHCGYVDEGLRFFRAMVRDFQMKPELVHYGCVVDLLCRGGRLSEARDFIESIPIEPDPSLWRALLGACRVSSDSDAKFARMVFEKLVEIEPMNTANYVLLSNIYASEGIWGEVRKIRATLREKGLRKSPGISWIVVRSELHCFSSADTSHPRSETIYENLNFLTALIKQSGYVSQLHSILHQEKE